MWIIEVIPIKKGLPQDTLTYFSSEPVADGKIVLVPIRSKNIDAVVIGSRDARDEKAAIKSGSISLRKITEVKSDHPLSPCIFETAILASKYYKRQRGEILKMIVSDYSQNARIAKANAPEKKVTADGAEPERLIFQAPLEDRMAFYKTYIRESFARKESITFVCPTIADCELFSESLSKGIGEFVIVINSETPKKKLAPLIDKLEKETHPFVLVCTPTFASLMRPDLGTIILEHESSTAYFTQAYSTIDFRVIIEILARTACKKLIMGDSLLRVETLGRHDNNELGTAASVTFRALSPISVSVIPHGIPEELPVGLKKEQVPALSEQIRQIVSEALFKKMKVFCFSLRTGLATFTRCRDCGLVLACEYCGASLVLYAGGKKRVFICNKCKRHAPTECKCSRCDSWNLSALGTGTEFVEEEIKRLFPDLPVFRIDREATPNRVEAGKIAAQFSALPSAVLVGTEMALFYLNEPVTDSIIVSFDTLFNIPSYRTNERIISLLLAIAERTKNKLYVQTKNPHEPIIDLIRSNNYSSWYRSEIAERIEYNYPPASTIIKITWSGKEEDRTSVRENLAELLAPYAPDIFNGEVIKKGKKEYTVNLIIRPRREEWSLYALMSSKGLSESLNETLSKLPEGTTISINPDNLL